MHILFTYKKKIYTAYLLPKPTMKSIREKLNTQRTQAQKQKVIQE